MKSFQQKRRWRNIMESRPVLLFLGILVLVFAWSVIDFMGKMQVTMENRKIAENKLRELEEKKEELSSNIDNLKTDQGKEKIFRENFGLAKEGEGLIVVIDDKNKQETESTSDSRFFSYLFFWKNWFK